MDQSARKSENSTDGINDGANPAKLTVSSSPETETDGDEILERLLKWLDEMRYGSMCISTDQTDSVTINGDEEMCGSSFSAATATVMAGVDTKSAMGMGLAATPYFYGCSSSPPEVMKMAAEVEGGLISAGERRVGESAEEWVARVLNEKSGGFLSF